MPKYNKKVSCIYIYLIFLTTVCYCTQIKKSHELCEEGITSFPDLILSLSSKVIKEIPLNESFIISPLSITAALTMLYVGADGKTKSEMNKVLNFDKLEIPPIVASKQLDVGIRFSEATALPGQTAEDSIPGVKFQSISLAPEKLPSTSLPFSNTYRDSFNDDPELLLKLSIMKSKTDKSETIMTDVIETVEENQDALIGSPKIKEVGRVRFKRDLAPFNNLTLDQIRDLFIMNQFQNLIQNLELDSEEMSLMVANSVFIQNGFQVTPKYMQNIQKYLKSEIHYEDFANEKITTMENINEWVSKKTNAQIKKLLNEPLDQMTMMVLANVVYFKGLWKNPFYDTWNSHFKSVDGSRNPITFMKVEEFFNYYHDDTINYSFLEMDYNGGNISMLFALPENKSEIPNFYLDRKFLCFIRSKFQLRNVVVGIPKVHLEYRRELSKDMMKLGMESLFSDRADLTGIRDENDIHVSLMLHKAVIEMDEKGSKASGITGVGIDSRKRPVYDAIFWANHPFLYYIIEKTTDTVLFVGRVTKL